jgi:hypothetical protein
MILVLLKLTLAPALVGGASLVSRRWGPRAGGLAAALPIVAGPTLLFFALEQGLPFTAAAAHGTLLGLVPLCAFCLSHAVLAGALRGRVRRRVAAPLCLAAGWGAFLAVAALLRPVQLPGWGALLAGAGALLAGRALVPAIPADGEPPLRHHPALELGLRMLLAACLVTGLTALAGALGPTWSGLLTPFPVASSVLVLGTHLADGPDHLSVLLRGFLVGLHGFVAFLTVLAFGLVPLGVGAAFGLGLAASLTIAALVTWRPWQRVAPGAGGVVG